MVDSGLILCALTCLLCFILTGCQIYANRRQEALASFSTSMLPLCLASTGVMSLSGLVPGTDGLYALPVNLMFGIFPLLLLASPFLPKNKAVIYLSFLSCLVFNVLILYGVAGDGWRLPVRFYGFCAVCLSAFYALYCVVSLWGYVRRVRNVVQKTTIWTMLSVSVDAVYVFFMIGLSMAFYIGTDSPPRVSVWIVSLTVMQLWLTMAALVYRISTDSLFFVMRKHEMIILESLNDVPGDMARGRIPPEDMYRELYSRIVEYFENDMPYLSGDLMLDDLVKVVFANKLYISQAISRCSGRNFCQFVNYYRIKYSVDVFRQNPKLKVAELALQCGFNSAGSFSSAFKLYMNESPSDWMRQERSRLIKCKHPVI